jgi:phage shock protein A
MTGQEETGHGRLEAELHKSLADAVAADPKAKEALAAEGGLEVSPTDLIGLLLAKQAALEQAVLRLAREMDRSSTR